MTNEEIDLRLRTTAEYMTEHTRKSLRRNGKSIQLELELLNMSLLTVALMLGEIAKRLPSHETDLNLRR